MKLRVVAVLTAMAVVELSAAIPLSDLIVVSPNHHFFADQFGTPFFWLGDTAWLLFSKLNRDETLRYLDNRAGKGFNVIHVMVLNDPQIKTASRVPALVDGDPAKPFLNGGKDSYWDHIDWVIDRAAERGIYVGLVAAWGSLVKNGTLKEANAAIYGAFLAQRYKSKKNVVWIIGGDINGGDKPAVWNLLATTIKKQDPGHLMTFHPFGRMQSSMWFHNQPWLDFNMFQSGHRRYDQDTDSPRKYGEDNWRYVDDDYGRQPTKPVIDGEPSYEGIPQGLHDPKQPYWGASDVRRYAYWSVFAGAAGHTYGNNSIMQFFRPGDSPAYGAKEYWTKAIDDPGAGQMHFLKDLMLSRPYFERRPGQSLIAGDNGARYDRVAVTVGANYQFAYTYSGKPFRLKLGAIPGAQITCHWYSPRDGSMQSIGTFPNRGEREFTPPGSPRDGNDWVLVVDELKLVDSPMTRRAKNR
jgi:hypothetical protein